MNTTHFQMPQAIEGSVLGDIRYLFDAMPCIVSVHDRDFRLLQVNDSFQRAFGDDRVGEYCYKVFKGREKICPVCSVERTFLDGGVHHAEETIKTPAGEELDIAVTTAPLFDPDKNIVAAVKMSYGREGFSDIVERIMLPDTKRGRRLLNGGKTIDEEPLLEDIRSMTQPDNPNELDRSCAAIRAGSNFLGFMADRVIAKDADEEIDRTKSPHPVVTIQADVLKSIADEIRGHLDRIYGIVRHTRNRD